MQKRSKAVDGNRARKFGLLTGRQRYRFWDTEKSKPSSMPSRVWEMTDPVTTTDNPLAVILSDPDRLNALDTGKLKGTDGLAGAHP